VPAAAKVLLGKPEDALVAQFGVGGHGWGTPVAGVSGCKSQPPSFAMLGVKPCGQPWANTRFAGCWHHPPHRLLSRFRCGQVPQVGSWLKLRPMLTLLFGRCSLISFSSVKGGTPG
jgi:hypothetical protein